MSVVILEYVTDEDVGTRYGSHKSVAFTKQGDNELFNDVVAFIDSINPTDINGKWRFEIFAEMVAKIRKGAVRRQPRAAFYNCNMSISYRTIEEYHGV